MIGINTETLDGNADAIATAKDILQTKGATYRNIYFDSSSDAGTFALGIMAFPTTYVFDRNGNTVGEPLLGGIDNADNLAQLQKNIDAALAAVGLDSARTRETNALSGGQKQRLAIAGALAMKPRVVVLDEASSMLDPRGRAERSPVVAAVRAEGVTVISVTHSLEEAAQAGEDLMIMNGDVYMEEALLDQILAEKKIQYKSNGTWVMYSDYSDLGYESIKQETLDSGRVIYYRRITQLGRKFILGLFDMAA